MRINSFCSAGMAVAMVFSYRNERSVIFENIERFDPPTNSRARISPRSPAGGVGDTVASYFVEAGRKGIGIVLSPDGRILGVKWGKNDREQKAVRQPLIAFSGIAGFRQSGKTVVRKDKESALLFTRKLVNDSLKRSCVFIEKFTPTENSIHWELEIRGEGQPWSGEINTEIEYPATEQTRFWTTWGSPPYEPSSPADKQLLEDLRPVPGGSDATGFIGQGNNQWVDPLVAVPFADTSFFYGLPYFSYENPRLAVCPFQGNLFCIPLCSVLEPGPDRGLTFALSPADDVIDLVMKTSQKGRICFSRLFNRISSDRPLRFAMDITAHPADWRAGLGWVAARYPGYFQPKNGGSAYLAGTGAYAGPFEVIENRKMRDMDFTTNWQASFDFPYMGMFLPPVKKDQRWKRFGDSTISINQMESYAKRMRAAGFHVLNYFNVTEFGAKVKYPDPSGAGRGSLAKGSSGAGSGGGTPPEADWWRECNTFLYRKLPHAILSVPLRMKLPVGSKMIPGGPIYTWEDGIVMDCGDAVYRDFLLDQALRHIREIPDADGICIDRLDWLRMFNEQADDGRTWFENKPVRSLLYSFKQLMDTLGPLMHRSGKSIFVNNHDKRIDVLKQADGIFDEFTYAGAPLNLSAFLCVEKPALGWTDAAATVKKEGVDNFFQKYLYMGVFPMCPYPANDHSIMPDSVVDGYYIEYAPLLRQMRGRKWVLKPHVISVEGDQAKANLFTIPGGWAIPVVYGRTGSVRVHLANVETDANVETSARPGAGAKGGRRRVVSYKAWYPGKKEGVPVKVVRMGDETILDLPLVRGCAMIICSR